MYSFNTREMIFEQLFYRKICDNFLSHTHITFLLSYIVTIFVFFVKNMIVYLVVKQMDVQITLLLT